MMHEPELSTLSANSDSIGRPSPGGFDLSQIKHSPFGSNATAIWRAHKRGAFFAKGSGLTNDKTNPEMVNFNSTRYYAGLGAGYNINKNISVGLNWDYYDGSQSDKNVAPKASLTWTPSDTFMTYALVDKGFRFGGPNLSPSTTAFDESRAP